MENTRIVASDPLTGSVVPGAYDVGGPDGYRFKQQLAAGDFAEFRRFLAQAKLQKNWDDRVFMLWLVASHIPVAALDAADAAEPGAPDLALIRGALLAKQVRESRGSRRVEQTSQEQFQAASQVTQIAIPWLQHAAALAPDDPTPHYLAMDPFMIFSMTDGLFGAYREAVRIAPDFVSAHRLMVNARSEKWGGSHAEAFQVARTAIANARSGSDMAVCLFLAHFHVWQYHRVFKKNKTRAEAYLRNKKANEELNEALEQWIGGDYRPRPSSIPFLHQAALWYYLVKDGARLRRIFNLTNGVQCDIWNTVGDPVKALLAAQSLAAAGTSRGIVGGLFGWFKR